MNASEALAAILPSEALEPDSGTGRPEAVVRPSTTDEVATLMAWASREGVGVLPVWRGNGVARPAGDGRFVVLSTERLDGIETYEAADLTITAGAGTPLSTVRAALASNEQWLPFDPPFVDRGSLGGLVAVGESGPLRTGYGDLRNHVLGLTVVTGDGRSLDLGGRVVKNVAGYDLLKSVVGSRGTLAVITSVCVRAFPTPAVDRLLVLRGSSVRALLPAALEIGVAPVLPASCVIADEWDGRGAALVVRLHGATETVDADRRTLERHLRSALQEHRGTFEEIDAVTSSALTAMRDRAADHPTVIQASVRPSRLDRAMESLERLRPEALVVDGYSGFVLAGSGVDSLDDVDRVRTELEELGGALRVARADRDPAIEAVRTRARPGEQALADRLRVAFDPEGVLWPARR